MSQTAPMRTTPELLADAMANLDEQNIVSYAQQMLTEGYSISQIQESMNSGMKRVGDFFEQGEYFIADLMVSGTFYKMVLDMLPAAKPARKLAGRVVIGVVEKDLHDIGKDMVIATLESNGYQVTDLGIDVPAEKFIEAVRTLHPQVLLLSGMMAPSRVYMKKTIDALSRAGLREGLHIIVGGGCITPSSREQIGADASARDLAGTVEYCNAYFEGTR